MNRIIISTLLFLACCNIQAKDIYISSKGNDANNGSKSAPIKSLEKAKVLVHEYLTSNKAEDINILMDEGVYYLDKSLVFNKEDISTSPHGITISSLPNKKVVITGNKTIPYNDWEALSKEAKSRVHPKVNPANIKALDLRKLGIRNTQPFPDSFVMAWNSIDLFADGKRMPISQFPNQNEKIGKCDIGWVTCNGSKDERTFYYAEGGTPKDGDTTNELDMDGTNRTARWKKSIEEGHALWLKGNYRVPWDPITLRVENIDTNEKTIRFAVQPSGGMGSKYSSTVAGSNPAYRVGLGSETYFAINYLDEIDQPGEWAIDFKDQKLYFYPPSDLRKADVKIADNKEALIKLTGTANITIKDIVIDGQLGNGIDVSYSKNINIEGCLIKNTSHVGVALSKCSDVTVLSNDIEETGDFGIKITNCGSLEKITPGNIIISNNHIHDMGKLIFNGGLLLMGCCGVNINHNLINDSPRSGIENRNGINITMEYNEFHNMALRTGDTGAIYSYGGWYTYGNIVRYNLFHHIPRANAIYPDDGDSGDLMYNNILIGSVCISGGHDNLFHNNLVINANYFGIDDRGISRNYRLGTNYETNLAHFNINEEPWLSFGKELMAKYHYKTHLWNEILTPEYQPEKPRNCVVRDNVFINLKRKRIAGEGIDVEYTGNINMKSIEDAHFYDFKSVDLRTDNPKILNKIPNLNEIYPKIGLYKDEYRKQVLTRAEYGGLRNVLDLESDKEDKLIR
jgi:parallel beta-helix repeat protein